MRRKVLIRFLLIVLILVGLVLMANQIKSYGWRDYLAYWTAGLLISRGDNPYDVDQVMRMQQAQGLTDPRPLSIHYPPWSAVWLLPMGWLSLPLGRVLWFVCSILIFALCSVWLWDFYGGEKEKRWVAWAVTFWFAPTLLMLILGQINPVVFLGATGFLYFQSRRKDFLAGLALTLATMKPLLLFVFLGAAGLWALYERRWKVLAGLVAGLAAESLVVVSLHPTIFRDYTFYVSNNLPDLLTNSVPHLLRAIISPNAVWLQYSLVPFALIWMLVYWYKNKDDWQWAKAMPWLAAVTFVTTPFIWYSDLEFAAFTFLPVAVWGARGRLTWIKALFFAVLILAPVLPYFYSSYWNEFWWVGVFPLVYYAAWRLVDRRMPAVQIEGRSA